jgi:hypothetical protein
MRPNLSKERIAELQDHGRLLIEVSNEFAAFWEGPYITPHGDVCSICGGEFPFPSEHSWGIKPDRKYRPNLFICWECCHWLLKTLVEQVVSHSYNWTFQKYPPFEHTLGQPAGTSILTSGKRTEEET